MWSKMMSIAFAGKIDGIREENRRSTRKPRGVFNQAVANPFYML